MKEIEIGTTVIVQNNRGEEVAILKVEGETKTGWRVDGELYRKENLYLKGRSDYSRSAIVVATEEKLTEVRKKFKRSRMLNKVETMKWSDLTDEVLSQVVKIIEG